MFTASECYEQFYPGVLDAIRLLDAAVNISFPTFSKKPLGWDGIGSIEIELVALFADCTELTLHRREKLTNRRRGHVLGDRVDLNRWTRLYYILQYKKRPGGGSENYYFGTHRHTPEPTDHIHHASYSNEPPHPDPEDFEPNLLDCEPLAFVELVRQFRASNKQTFPLRKKP